MNLEIELVPETAWGNNIRTFFTKTEWDKLRRECYRKAGYVCEICGGKGPEWPVECHEVWEYKNGKQKLIRLIAICPKCHNCKHFGRSSIVGLKQECREHLMKVNNITSEQLNEYLTKTFKKWREQSKKEWELDLTILTTQSNMKWRKG